MKNLCRSAAALLVALLALSTTCSWTLLVEASASNFSAIEEAETIIQYHQGIVRSRGLRENPPNYGQSPPPPMNPAPHYDQLNNSGGD